MPAFLDQWIDSLHGLCDCVREVDRLASQLDAPLRDSRDIEQVIDEPNQNSHLPLHDADRPVRVRLSRSCAGQYFGCAANRCERIAQLMCEHREKLVLLPVRGLQPRARQHVGRDVAEVADNAEACVRQRNTADLPFVILDDSAVGASLDSFGSEVRFARRQCVPKKTHEFIRELRRPQFVDRHVEVAADEVRGVAKDFTGDRVRFANPEVGVHQINTERGLHQQRLELRRAQPKGFFGSSTHLSELEQRADPRQELAGGEWFD